MLRVEWDEAKNETDKSKHGLSFEEAAELFRSETDYLEIFDSEHSEEEDRFICVGPIARGVILVVKTEWSDDHIRIISPRFATKRERASYVRYTQGNAT